MSKRGPDCQNSSVVPDLAHPKLPHVAHHDGGPMKLAPTTHRANVDRLVSSHRLRHHRGRDCALSLCTCFGRPPNKAVAQWQGQPQGANRLPATRQNQTVHCPQNVATNFISETSVSRCLTENNVTTRLGTDWFPPTL